MKVAIATPYYENKGYAPYIRAINETVAWLEKEKIPTVHLQTSGVGWVTLAKNNLLALFLKTDCTHFFMIDSDLRWDVEGFKRVLMAPVDFVGAAYPLKEDAGRFWAPIFRTVDGKPRDNIETGLIEAESVPGGFMRLSRRVVERLYKAYEVLQYDEPDITGVWLFDTAIVERLFRSEDAVFCQRWRALGEKVWLEPNVNFGHSGTKEWTDNFNEYLLNGPTRQKDIPGYLESFTANPEVDAI